MKGRYDSYGPRGTGWISEKERPQGISNHEWKSCKRKAVFETEAEAAVHKGQRPYSCRYCGKWHRGSTDGTISHDLLAIARRNAKRLRGR